MRNNGEHRHSQSEWERQCAKSLSDSRARRDSRPLGFGTHWLDVVTVIFLFIMIGLAGFVIYISLNH